jgi:isopentenyl phosphate kinase
VKLGGSLLTDKAREQAFRPGRAARLMRELAAAGGPLVLVHGAGSFGHPQARRHKAALAKPGSKQGLAVAERAGLETSPINVDGRGLDAKALREVKAALAVDRVPVLHGTLVLDGKGWRVLGGDELMAVLALALKPERAVWASDVAGVYDRDPRAGRATLLGEAKAGGATTGRGADVTGRMAGKLAWAAQVAAVCPTWIVGGHVPGRLGKALGGTPVGTRVLA